MPSNSCASPKVLDRSLRVAEGMTALERGWLLAEFAPSFGQFLEYLARQFDRSTSSVSRVESAIWNRL
ncbi:MAG: hypothetical protein ABSH28_23615 [Acidobacteriota bacterium]